VFDVGANRGGRTDIFLGLGAKVVAIEPNPECAACIRARYNSRSLEVENIAVGKSAGVGDFYVCPFDGLSTLSEKWVATAQQSDRFAAVKWSKPVRVPIRTLDALVRQYGIPTFVKIDVEGFEREVLTGLTHQISCLSFEFNTESQGLARECIDIVDRLGSYRFNFSLVESMKLASERWLTASKVASALKDTLSRTPPTYGDVYALQASAIDSRRGETIAARSASRTVQVRQ